MTIFAPHSLGTGSIYTVGFKATRYLSPLPDLTPKRKLKPPITCLQSVDMQIEQPFVIASALPREKAMLVQPLPSYYGRAPLQSSSSAARGTVYLDLTDGDGQSGEGDRDRDPLRVAKSYAWTGYGIEEVHAWTVEMLRLLVRQNVPIDFARMASGI